MKKEKKLVIIGDDLFAEIAFEYFTADTEYDVVGFAVERDYKKRDALFGLSVVAVEGMESIFDPRGHYFYAAVGYSQKNRLRERLYGKAKGMGYAPASYVSPRAFVWRNVKLGEHVFICENNVVQPYVTLGDNVVLWSGNQIGHHSAVGDHCFISAHCVVSGGVSISKRCFLGVNCTLRDKIVIGDDCIIGAGTLVLDNVSDGDVVAGTPSEIFDSSLCSELDFF